MSYFWSKHKGLIIIGSFALTVGIFLAVYFIFFYTPPAPPEVIPDTHISIEIKIDELVSESTETPDTEEIPDEVWEETNTALEDLLTTLEEASVEGTTSETNNN